MSVCLISNQPSTQLCVRTAGKHMPFANVPMLRNAFALATGCVRHRTAAVRHGSSGLLMSNLITSNCVVQLQQTYAAPALLSVLFRDSNLGLLLGPAGSFHDALSLFYMLCYATLCCTSLWGFVAWQHSA